MASASKSAWRNPSYLQSSFGIFMFFCSWGIWWPFFRIWLEPLGLSGTEVGIIYSINSAATMIIMFVYGIIQDQLGIKRDDQEVGGDPFYTDKRLRQMEAAKA